MLSSIKNVLFNNDLVNYIFSYHNPHKDEYNKVMYELKDKIFNKKLENIEIKQYIKDSRYNFYDDYNVSDYKYHDLYEYFSFKLTDDQIAKFNAHLIKNSFFYNTIIYDKEINTRYGINSEYMINILPTSYNQLINEIYTGVLEVTYVYDSKTLEKVYKKIHSNFHNNPDINNKILSILNNINN